MLLFNWMLAIVGLTMWIGVLYWYFQDEIRNWRTRRYDKWFKGD